VTFWPFEIGIHFAAFIVEIMLRTDKLWPWKTLSSRRLKARRFLALTLLQKALQLAFSKPHRISAAIAVASPGSPWGLHSVHWRFGHIRNFGVV